MEAARLFSELDELEGEARTARLARIEAERPELMPHLNRLLGLHESDAGGGLHDRLRERIGKYEILEVLGRGAVGTVYQVREPETDHVFALKLFAAQQNDQTLVDEIRMQWVAEGTPHPNLVPIRETGRTDDGCIFFTMDFMEGGDLAARMARTDQPLPTADVLRWMHQVAGALAHLHAAGIVHQDIKPANIFLDKKGNARLGDFSIALLSRHGESASVLTRSMVGGSYYFMAPEQWLALTRRDHAVPARASADVCSFGLTLYKLLTGMVQIGDRASLVPRFPDNERLAEHLDGFLGGCLKPEPSERFCDGRALLEALERVLARVEDLGALYSDGTKARRDLERRAVEVRIEDLWAAHDHARRRGALGEAEAVLDRLQEIGVDTLRAREALVEAREKQQTLRGSFRHNLSRQAFVEALVDLEALTACSDLGDREELARFREDQELSLWQRWAQHLDLSLDSGELAALIAETREVEAVGGLNGLISRHEFDETDPRGKDKALLLTRFAYYRFESADHARDLSEALVADVEKRRLWQKRAANAGDREAAVRLADDLYRNGAREEAWALYSKVDARPPRAVRAMVMRTFPILVPLAILLVVAVAYSSRIRALKSQLRTDLEGKQLGAALDTLGRLMDPLGDARAERNQLAAYILEDLVFESDPARWGPWYQGPDQLQAVLPEGKTRTRIEAKAADFEQSRNLRARAEEELVGFFGFSATSDRTRAFRTRLRERYGSEKLNEILSRTDEILAANSAYTGFVDALVTAAETEDFERLQTAIEGLPVAAERRELLAETMAELAVDHAYRAGIAEMSDLLPLESYGRTDLVALEVVRKGLSPTLSDLDALGRAVARLIEANLDQARENNRLAASLRETEARAELAVSRVEDKERLIAAAEEDAARSRARLACLSTHLTNRDAVWRRVMAGEPGGVEALEEDRRNCARLGVLIEPETVQRAVGLAEERRALLASRQRMLEETRAEMATRESALRDGLAQLVANAREGRGTGIPTSLSALMTEGDREALKALLVAARRGGL